ncbi:hypothetical protein [Paraburkholderia phenoliruptrix]|uniref:hypothetical protein n=1 Tax=Paraburkholderia phenoliruptrix TaxID=252970 RepID=UPI0034CD9850
MGRPPILAKADQYTVDMGRRCGGKAMLNLVDELSHLRAADDNLRTAVYLISVQEALIGKLRAAHRDTQVAEQLLSTMQSILPSFISHRLAICDAIELERRSLGLLTRTRRPGSDI